MKKAFYNGEILKCIDLLNPKYIKKYLKDYHLRIASVSRDYGMFDRKEAPKDSFKFHQE